MSLKDRLKEEVMTEFRKAEKAQRHELQELFNDVYAGELPYNLVCHSVRLYDQN